MQTTNKKLIKEIRAIFIASDKAKKLALLELDKIDAKYKALAEKEKTSLNETIKFLDTQLNLYGPMLSDADKEEVHLEPDDTVTANEDGSVSINVSLESDEDKKEEETKEETADEPEKVVDTIFPENNEEDSAEEKEATPEEDDINSIWPDETSTEESAETSNLPTEESEKENTINADEWPEMPEEWK